MDLVTSVAKTLSSGERTHCYAVHCQFHFSVLIKIPIKRADNMKFLEATKCCFVVGDLKLAGLLIAALMLLSLVACVPVSSIYLLVVYGMYYSEIP